VHVIWSVKNRKTTLLKPIRYSIFSHIEKNAEEKGIKILIVNGVEDHLHCLIQMHPLQNLSGLVKQIKGESSRWINENKLVAGDFEWQDGYAAYTVSPNGVKKMMNYIHNQEKHHIKETFAEELKSFEN